ncbi:MAG: PAS domain S-box protein, partial [Candidatus Neomarinimicrobiota bacterium]
NVPEKPIKILMIEDSTFFSQYIKKMLAEEKSDGFDVELKYTDQLSVGLELIEEDEIDVILLDLTLPDSEGLDTFTRTSAQASELPIIVISGLGDEKLATEIVQKGAQDYLIKSQVNNIVLKRSILYAMQRKQAEIEINNYREHLEELIEKRTQELQISKAKIQNIFDSASDGIYALDLKGNFTEVNQRMLDMYGFGTFNEMLGTNGFDLIPPSEIEKAKSVMGEVLEKGEISSLEYFARKIDGSEFPVSVSSSILKDASGNAVGTIGIARDITDRKLAEEELKKHRDHLEELVESRTGELRKTINLMAGREVRMAELKDTIKALRTQLQETGMTPVADDPLKEEGIMNKK